MRGEEKTQTTVIWVLAILLVLAVGYIGYNVYTGVRAQQQAIVFQEGAGAGYQQAVVQLMQQAATCQAVPVTFENVTLNLIAVECLQVPQAAQTAQAPAAEEAQ